MGFSVEDFGLQTSREVSKMNPYMVLNPNAYDKNERNCPFERFRQFVQFCIFMINSTWLKKKYEEKPARVGSQSQSTEDSPKSHRWTTEVGSSAFGSSGGKIFDTADNSFGGHRKFHLWTLINNSGIHR